jgi:hypothetical protein
MYMSEAPTTHGSTLLYGPATRRAHPEDLPARISRLLRDGGVDAAFTVFSEAASSRMGNIAIDPEISTAAALIAAAQVTATYAEDSAYMETGFAENRGPEEAHMIRQQATYLTLAATTGNEPPGDPSLHLYRWAERFDVLRTSPISRTLLPMGVFGRDAEDYMRDLPAAHRRLMDEVYEGEGSNLLGEIHGQLIDLLIDGDEEGFCGLQKRLQVAAKALGSGGLPVPLLDVERGDLGRVMAEQFHPLPGRWLDLRKQVAQAEAVKAKIRDHLKTSFHRLELIGAAEDQDWQEIAVACLAYYDEQAKEDLTAVARRIGRRR